MLPWVSITPRGFAVVPEVWMIVASWSRVILPQPSSHSRCLPGSLGASSMTSSSVMEPGGSVPFSSMTTSFSRVGHSARTASILAACWAFSTTTSLALTLLMMKPACPASELG